MSADLSTRRPATAGPGAAHHPSFVDSLRGQPRAVWVTAFAAVIAFMGIGLVDPILLSIAEGLDASESQVTLLFASYLGFQVVAMLVTGVVAARLGTRTTLMLGLSLIVVFAGLCATAGSIGELVGLRAFWGPGNALFIATALSCIVGAAVGGQASAILLYEAALGLGISAGPLVGAVLGGISWRMPFVGTSVLMLVGLVLVATMMPKDVARPTGPPSRVRDPLLALRDRRLLGVSLASGLYTFGFFTVLAWSPFVLQEGPYFIGLVFFGWGLMIAVFSVAVAPRVAAALGEQRAVIVSLLVYALLLVAFVVGDHAVVVAAIVASGAVSGVLNTLLTGAAMQVSDAPRPVASAGYNFLRWMGGALAAVLVAHVAAWTGSERGPFVVAIVTLLLAVAAMAADRAPSLDEAHEVPLEAAAVGDAD